MPTDFSGSDRIGEALNRIWGERVRDERERLINPRLVEALQYATQLRANRTANAAKMRSVNELEKLMEEVCHF